MRQIDRPPCPNPAKLARDYKYPENKEALKQASFSKCMYCESYVDQVYPGDVEHIKPKSIFPNLEFTWENLGYVCSICNNRKRDFYSDSTPLLDPYSENPEGHMVAAGPVILPYQGSERGELTINVTDLNRTELIDKRQTRLHSLSNAISACFRTRSPELKDILLEALVEKEGSKAKEYSFCANAFLKNQNLL